MANSDIYFGIGWDLKPYFYPRVVPNTNTWRVIENF